MRVLGETSASNKLLLTGGADHNGLLNGALVRGVQGLHVENVDALHLTENLETLETSRLLKIRRDGTSLGTGADEVVNGLDICAIGTKELVSIELLLIYRARS